MQNGGASPTEREPRRLRFGIFEADLREHVLTRSGHRVGIQDQPFRLLALLLERPGELVTRDEIRHAIWPDGTAVDFERGVNTAVNKLRGALRDTADSPKFIATEPRRGYRFVAPVEIVEGDAKGEGTAVPAELASAQPADSGHRRSALVVASMLVVVAVVLAFWVSRQSDLPASGSSQASDARVARPRLAVLPFENLSGNEEQDFFSVGLTEEMTSRLGRLAPGKLGVIARTTMMGYQNTQRPIEEIAAELDVDYVLEGSVRRSGDRARITAQLIRATDQTHLWSADYDSNIEDILSVQAEVARRVAASLAVEVLPTPEAGTSVDPDAYDAYLRGLHFRDMLTEAGYRKAIQSFELALSLDPDFAPAYAAMSACFCLLAGHGLEVADPETLMPRTREFATRALELDGTLADAQGALGMAYFKHEWDWDRAEAALSRATEMNPSDPMARIWYAFYLASQRRHDESVFQVDEAKRADPFSRVVNVNWAWQRYEARRYQDSADKFDETLELFPGFWVAHWGRGLSLLQLGDGEAALDDLGRAVEISEGSAVALGALAFAHATLGNSSEARRILRTLLDRSREGYVPSVTFVGIYGALGELDAAFEWLERAHAERSRSMAWIQVAHEFDPLREDPRFAVMLARMDLAL